MSQTLATAKKFTPIFGVDSHPKPVLYFHVRNHHPQKEPTVLGYCVRCKSKQEMLSATRTLMKNGRRAMLGLCRVCGTKMSVAGKWDSEAANLTVAVETPSLTTAPTHLTPQGQTG
jgi:hypothetical protein